MQKAVARLSLALLLCVISVHAEHWAVLVAGSNGYWNYRHQADICHAYHVLRGHGIEENRIITFLYNDVANDTQNPFPGTLFNKPSPTSPGFNVYEGCKVDYNGTDVSPENFLKVIRGDAEGMKGLGTGRVLNSTKKDRVFINFSDHGATGLIAFPNKYLYANDLLAAFKEMHDKEMYKEMVVYLEACESGSMFENLLHEDLNIYVTTASNAEESSWGTYCGPDDMVNGVSIGSCLGDLYSVNWMEDSDLANMKKETLIGQYGIVKNKTTQSHVMEYGNMNISKLIIGDFQGHWDKEPKEKHVASSYTRAPCESITVDSRDIKLHYLYNRYRQNSLGGHEGLVAELDHRRQADQVFQTAANKLQEELGVDAFQKVLPRNFFCLKDAVDGVETACGKFSDYSLKYVRVLAAMCEANIASGAIVAMFQTLCTSQPAPSSSSRSPITLSA